MDVLADKGLIVNSSRLDLLGNRIVLIAGKQVELGGFEGLTGAAVARVSIGTPETVPAGKYAKETLGHLGIWEELQPKLVLAKDVRQILTYVETGNVDAGMVFYTDAIVGEVRVIAAVPPGSHAPIVYPMALIKAGP